MDAWNEALRALEHADFELNRCEDPGAAAPWMEQRAAALAALAALPPDTASHRDRLRLAQASARAQNLHQNWTARSGQIRSQAGELYSAQLILKALRPGPLPRHLQLYC